MYVYVYSIDNDGSMYKWCRMKPNCDVPKAALMMAVISYLEGYVEDYGCDFDDAKIVVHGVDGVGNPSIELTLSTWEGEPGVMYFTTEAHPDAKGK